MWASLTPIQFTSGALRRHVAPSGPNSSHQCVLGGARWASLIPIQVTSARFEAPCGPQWPQFKSPVRAWRRHVGVSDPNSSHQCAL